MKLTDIVYDPSKSISANAEDNHTSEALIRKYIHAHQIDRKGDVMRERKQDAERLQKRGLTRMQIAEQLGLSYGTVQAYLAGKRKCDTPKGKQSAYALDNVLSYSNSLSKIVHGISTLYHIPEQIDCDLNYYEQSDKSADRVKSRLHYNLRPNNEEKPIRELESMSDAAMQEMGIQSIILQLPFRVEPMRKARDKEEFDQEYGSFEKKKPTIEELYNAWDHKAFWTVNLLLEVHCRLIQLAYRLLPTNGYFILVVKDTFYERNFWTARLIEDYAYSQKFKLVDRFILIDSDPPLRVMRSQQCARKVHSTVLLLQK